METRNALKNEGILEIMQIRENESTIENATL